MLSCTTIFGPDVVVVGDPVDVVTGANLDRQSDFVLAGPLPLPWVRWYDSSRNWQPGGHGWGHTHEYEQKLVFDLDGMRYLGPSAGSVKFPPLDRDGDDVGVGGYSLRRVDPRTYTLTRIGQPTATFVVPDGRPFAVLVRLQLQEARVGFQYDKDGYLGAIIDSTGRPIRVEYDSAGRVSRLSMPAPDGRTKQLAAYQYDAAGNLVRVTDPYNHILQYQFDGENRQVRRVDRRGYGFVFAYDAAGRCVRAGGEDRTQEVRLEYAPEHNTTLVTRADGGQWLYQYDAGVVTKVIDPDGGIRQFAKDEGGRVAAEVDPIGNPTQRLYDPAGALLGTIDPFGYLHLTGEAEYTPHGYPIASRAAEWGLGDLFLWELIVPPAVGDPAVTALGSAARYVQTRQPGTPPRPVREEDDFGQRFRETFQDGSSRRWVYDPNGNVAKYTDRDGGVTTYEYASWNALVAEINPAGGRVRYEYAPSGMATAVTDAGGTRSEYRYDQQDRLVEIRRHGNIRETYERDAAGNLVCKRDGAGRELMRQEIGPQGLPLSCAFATGEVHTFAYDPRGRFLQAATDGFTVAFGYVREFQTADLRDGIGVEHQLGPDGVAATTIFGALKIAYRWLSPDEYAVTDPTGREHRIRSVGGGLVERTTANGCHELDQYDANGRCLVRITTGDRGIRARVFRYSSEGCLTAVEDSVRGTTGYRYDPAHRLIGIDRPDGTSAPIDLDAAGNILRMPGLAGVALGDGNRLLETNGERFEYDTRNHIATRTGSAGSTRYHYDANDMLVRIESPGRPDWTAGYDPFCRRVWKQWGERRIEFWWDTDRIIAERDETGQLRVYVYADDYALVPLLFVDYASGETDPANGRLYTVHTDQIGTPIEVRNETGRVVWEAEIAPYGAATMHANGVELNLRFPGHYHDTENGLHYNRFRYYDPALGRYLQSDPIGVGGGLNLYGYPARPLDKVDIRGLSGDDLTPAERKAYDQTRGGTPSQARRDECNEPGSVCAATGKPADSGKSLAADHVVPLKSIVQMDGFTSLTPEQQKAVANNPANFQPMKGGENSSKGGKEVEDWKQCRGKDLDPAARAAMIAKAEDARVELQAHIDKMNADNKKLKPGEEATVRACSGCKPKK